TCALPIWPILVGSPIFAGSTSVTAIGLVPTTPENGPSGAPLAMISGSRECVQCRASAAPRRLNRSDVDLLHAHHRIEGAFCFTAADRQRLGQHARRDLPRDAPSVLAPAARALLPAIADDGVPVAVRLLLIVSGDLEREGFVMFERGAAVKAHTRNAGNREFDRQHVALLAGRIIARGTVDGAHFAVRKRLDVEAGSSLGVLIVPEANRVLRHLRVLSVQRLRLMASRLR